MPTYKDIEIHVPEYLVMPVTPDAESGAVDFLNGTENEFYKKLVLYMNDNVPKRPDQKKKLNRFSTSDGMYHYYANVALEFFTIPMLQVVVGLGGTIENVPLYWQITLTDAVPDDLRLQDEDGNPVATTWQEYFDANSNRQPIIDQDGNTWAASSFYKGRYEEVSAAFARGFTYITAPEMVAIQATGE